MSKTEINKRHVQHLNARSMEAPKDQPKTEGRTVKCHEVPEWQIDSKISLAAIDQQTQIVWKSSPA